MSLIRPILYDENCTMAPRVCFSSGVQDGVLLFFRWPSLAPLRFCAIDISCSYWVSWAGGFISFGSFDLFRFLFFLFFWDPCMYSSVGPGSGGRTWRCVMLDACLLFA